MEKYHYHILDYDLYQKELDRIILESKAASHEILVHNDFIESSLGIKIDHLTIGEGPNHLIVMGGTHGTEIISVDFVLKLMESISKSEFEFRHFDPKKFTIHFIPLHNPEGFIIVTSVLKTKLKNKNLKQTINFAHRYYEYFKKDDLLSEKEQGKLKRHQHLFKNTSYKNIPLKFENIRLSVKDICFNEQLPACCLIDWRSNGTGVELNRNSPFTYYNANREIGDLRYNNLFKNTIGPLGKTSPDATFSFANENVNINNLLIKLYNEKKYIGLFTYHSTWGTVFYKPSALAPDDFLPLKKRNQILKVNRKLAENYIKYTGYSLQENPSFEGLDEFYRAIYPAVLLIELSKMGGNPLGPYGDISNYQRVIHDNLVAFSETLPLLLKLKKSMYK